LKFEIGMAKHIVRVCHGYPILRAAVTDRALIDICTVLKKAPTLTSAGEPEHRKERDAGWARARAPLHGSDFRPNQSSNQGCRDHPDRHNNDQPVATDRPFLVPRCLFLRHETPSVHGELIAEFREGWRGDDKKKAQLP
jgi:hypothetical protein